MTKRNYGKNLGKFLHARGAKAPTSVAKVTKPSTTRKSVKAIAKEIRGTYS
jgi:hypothetical protein